MMSEYIKMYQVETQKDYDDLMIELEQQGYKWMSGDKPTTKAHYWDKQRENTIIVLDGFDKYRITRGSMSWCKGFYSSTPIIKHKVKGVKQMEKVVVPQFVADWFEQNKKGVTIYGLLHLFSDNYYLFDGFRQWVEDYDLKEEDAQEIISKMYLFQDYEIEVDEKKKYYWCKKKEYLMDFERYNSDNYVNFDTDKDEIYCDNNIEFGFIRTKFTEREIRELVSEEDFNKLEKVEITD